MGVQEGKQKKGGNREMMSQSFPNMKALMNPIRISRTSKIKSKINT